MRAVILAAGDGGRLEPHTSALPKPLIDCGRPLIEFTLDALAETGVSEVVVVTGYRRHSSATAWRQSVEGASASRS